MQTRFLRLLVVLALPVSLLAWSQTNGTNKIANSGGDFSNNTQPATKVPTGVILVKGAWSSASDSVTPVPEGGRVSTSVYSNQYFGMTYSLPAGWTQKY